ncbi:MAG: helix-turn-helix domain-containing protein [Oceanihabitans sp.]
MENNITQLHNTTPEKFKAEIISEVEKLLKNYLNKIVDKDELLTREQAAKLLAISLPTLRNYVKRGLISKSERRIGVRVMYDKKELLNSLVNGNKLK